MEAIGLGGLVFVPAQAIAFFVMVVTMAISESRLAKNDASFCNAPHGKTDPAMDAARGGEAMYSAPRSLAERGRLDWRRPENLHTGMPAQISAAIK